MNQQQLKFGITSGIVGILLLSYASLVQSKPPVPIAPVPIETKFPAGIEQTPPVQKLPLTAQIKINGRAILLEVARTPEQQSIGLMNRTDLALDRGMLFIFSPPRPVSFWMKNTLIPLDMIFMSNGVVKHIGKQILPCAADPCPGYGPAPTVNIDRVIELRGGSAATLQLTVGDRLKISNYSAKRLK